MRRAPSLRRVWFAALGCTVAALAAGALHWYQSRASPEERPAGQAGKEAKPKQPYAPARGLQTTRAEVAQSVDELLRDGSHRAWQKIAALYKGGDENTRRKILEHASRVPDLEHALGYVLATVGDDPTPIGEDRMIAEAASLLRRRWTRPEQLDRARELMLLQQTEKRKLVMTRAMTEFAATTTADPAFASQRRRLLASLVDAHSSASSDGARADIVADVRKLGASDLALVLEQGPNVNVAQLDVVKAENAAAERARAELGKRSP